MGDNECSKDVRVEGLEPPHLTALDPKSSVSTNFTTPAIQRRRKYRMKYSINQAKKMKSNF